MSGGKRERIEAVLQRMSAAEEVPVALLASLMGEVRPEDTRKPAQAAEHLRVLLDLMAAREDYRHAVGRCIGALFGGTKQVSFYAESGILPQSGFFAELWRKIAHRLLPPALDTRYLLDSINAIYSDSRDHLWVAALSEEERREFWHLLSEPGIAQPWLRRALRQMLDATDVIAYRLAAIGLDPELLRVCPDLDEHGSSFIGLQREVQRFCSAYPLEEGAAPAEDEKQVLVLIDQCREVMERAHRSSAKSGTSLRLTYLLKRASQLLERLELVVALLASRFHADLQDAAVRRWTAFFGSAVQNENRRNSIRRHFSELIGLLALRVTENAGRVGEHYITSDRAGWYGMWRSAMGAGAIVGVMALAKLHIHKLGLAPLNEALGYSLNYAAGFVLVHVLHFAIATKQPAMTAATIAATIGSSGGRMRDSGRLMDLIVDVARSQFAAIVGNVALAFPVAVLIGYGIAGASGGEFISWTKAYGMLEDVSPVDSLALLHAAIAGVWLFLSGLVSGYFDNRAAYEEIGPRVAALRWLRHLAGQERAQRLGAFVERNLGGLAGNIFLGVMLGITGTLGFLVGLPLDIRHVAFSAANFGYALVGVDFSLDPWTWAKCVAGIGLIGFVNLAVSFSLALWVAMRSRGVTVSDWRGLAAAIWQRFRSAPARFFLPIAPRGHIPPAGGA